MPSSLPVQLMTLSCAHGTCRTRGLCDGQCPHLTGRYLAWSVRVETGSVQSRIPAGVLAEAIWAAAMFSDSSSPVNWVGKSPGGAIHVS